MITTELKPSGFYLTGRSQLSKIMCQFCVGLNFPFNLRCSSQKWNRPFLHLSLIFKSLLFILCYHECFICLVCAKHHRVECTLRGSKILNRRLNIQAMNCRCLSLSQLIRLTDDNSRAKGTLEILE